MLRMLLLSESQKINYENTKAVVSNLQSQCKSKFNFALYRISQCGLQPPVDLFSL